MSANTATTTTATAVVDIEVHNDGSIFLFVPMTDAGEEWLRANTDGMWLGGALAVEHRYARDLADGAQADGLVLVWPLEAQ